MRWLRQLGIGALAQRYYYQPKSYIAWLGSDGWSTGRLRLGGEAAMQRAVRTLSPCPDPAIGNPLEVAFLTGKRFWHQTAFCAHSLARHLPVALRPTFFDDGTLSPAHAHELRRLFPAGQIREVASIQSALESRLPRDRFPLLHETAARVPIFRKLLHLRGSAPGWQLYLDSDMLFFGRPSFLEACARERRACYMIDPVYGYCLSTDELSALAGRAVLSNVNTGIVGLDNDRIDWEYLESLLGRTPPSVRLHRLFEQTLTAILLTEFEATPAAATEYSVVESPWFEPPAHAVLLHYIRNAKWPYVASEWRRVLRAA